MFTDHQKKEIANFYGSNSFGNNALCCSDKDGVLAFGHRSTMVITLRNHSGTLHTPAPVCAQSGLTEVWHRHC